jgi:hypothetical protein
MYCLPTAKMFARTRLSFELKVDGLPCFCFVVSINQNCGKILIHFTALGLSASNFSVFIIINPSPANVENMVN